MTVSPSAAVVFATISLQLPGPVQIGLKLEPKEEPGIKILLDDPPYGDRREWVVESNSVFAAPLNFSDPFARYAGRIDELRSLGDEDDITMRQASCRDFAQFIRNNPILPRASLVLTDSGNIRAIWKFGDERQIAIQFRGGGCGTFVVLKPDDDREPYGERSLSGLKALFEKA